MSISVKLSTEFLEEFQINVNQLSSDIVLNFHDTYQLLSFYDEFVNLHEDMIENQFITQLPKVGNLIAGYCHRISNYKYECKLMTNRLKVYTLIVTYQYNKIKKLKGDIVELINVFKDKFMIIIKNIEDVLVDDSNL
jgi:hypothetical protein